MDKITAWLVNSSKNFTERVIDSKIYRGYINKPVDQNEMYAIFDHTFDMKYPAKLDYQQKDGKTLLELNCALYYTMDTIGWLADHVARKLSNGSNTVDSVVYFIPADADSNEIFGKLVGEIQKRIPQNVHEIFYGVGNKAIPFHQKQICTLQYRYVPSALFLSDTSRGSEKSMDEQKSSGVDTTGGGNTDDETVPECPGNTE